MKSGFRRRINWNKYQSKVTIQVQKTYLDYLIDSRFQKVNKLFVFSFQNNTKTIGHTGQFLPKLKIKDYNGAIDGQNVFDQPVKSDMKTYDNIEKASTGDGDDYTTDFCLIIPISNNITK